MKTTINRKDFIHLSSFAGLGLSLTGFTPLKSFWKGKRIGIIGLDTSHAVAFAKALHDNSSDPPFMGYRIVAAYPKGSSDIASSVERIPGYTEEIKKLGIEIVHSIPELLKKVDCVCLETNDGRIHLQQALPVLQARKPVFIDKPITASVRDAVALFGAARKYNTPVFSSSSLRYIDGMEDVKAGKYGKVLGADTYSPAKLEKTHPDFFWYGIHGVEMLFTIMGADCVSAVRVHTPDTDVIVGTWSDGRIGTVRGTRNGKADYGGTVFAEKQNVELGEFKGYLNLLKEIVRFFDTGKPPVTEKETMAILAFMEAADESKRKKGMSVSLESVYRKAGYK